MVINPSEVSPSVSYQLLTSIIVPRPIAFVSTVSADGIPNLAPFSFFNGVCGEPPTLLFCAARRVPPKDTLVNIEAIGEFVVNVVTESLAEQMNMASAGFPPEVDEFAVTGLTPVPSEIVRPSRLRESPVNLECRLTQLVNVSDRPLGAVVVIGEVVRFHIDDRLLNEIERAHV